MDSLTDKQRILLVKKKKKYEEKARRLLNGECGPGYSSEDRQKMGDAYRAPTGCPEIDRKTVRAIQTLFAKPARSQVLVQRLRNRPNKRLLKPDEENDTASDTTSEQGEWDYRVAKKKREGARLKDDVFSDMCETKKNVECGSYGTD